MIRNIKPLARVTLFLLLHSAAYGDVLESSDRLDVKITAPTMGAALIQLSEQTGLQLVFPIDGASQIAAPKVEGKLTPQAALERLLQHSGLTFKFVNPRTVSVSLAKRSSAGESLTTTSSARP